MHRTFSDFRFSRRYRARACRVLARFSIASRLAESRLQDFRISNDENPRSEPRSFAETALAGEDARRRAEPIARPARTKFWRHFALFVAVNLIAWFLNVHFIPDTVIFYYVTIVWSFVLADNFLWAYVVDPDRDVAERIALAAERDRYRAHAKGESRHDE